MSSPPGSCQLFNFFQQVHGILQTIAWFVFTNIGIWALYFKSYSYGIFVHILCMCCGGFLMILSPMLMIGCAGPSILVQFWYHQTIGFVMYCVLPVMLVSGFVCKVSKDKPETSPAQVYMRARGHAIFGWIYIFFTQVPLLTGWYGGFLNNVLFGCIIIIDLISYITYIVLKFQKKRIQQESLNIKLLSKDLRHVRSFKDLRIYSENYFIFANYVYGLSKILASHPGGWGIIEKIRTREVDRFLYGVDPIEFYDVPRISHSLNSINLAGPPIAVLKIPQTYPLDQLTSVKISMLYSHDPNMLIHTVYLHIPDEAKFRGYTDLSQLGQYYSVTVNSGMTRLYTAVNFLQPANIGLVCQVSEGGIQIRKNFYSPGQIEMSNRQENLDAELSDFEKDHSAKTVLPLLIKKYGDGKFTSFFLSPNSKINEIKISQPRGLGLYLDAVTSKNIVIFAGGTGLYPYSDLIDLLFKDRLVEQNHKMSGTILESNLILKKKPFENFNFTFYVAVNEISELHPITLYQANYLSKSTKSKFYAKIKGKNLQKMAEMYKNIAPLNDRFQKLVQKQLVKNKDTVFYICGPVRFTRSLVVELQNQNVLPQNYKIV